MMDVMPPPVAAVPAARVWSKRRRFFAYRDNGSFIGRSNAAPDKGRG